MQVRNGKRAAVFALLAAAFIFVLFFFSGQSGDESNSLSMRLVQILFGGLIKRGMETETLNTVLRKLAHFGIFAIEGFLLGMALMNMLPKRKALPAAALICAFLAVASELYQTTSEGRTCSVLDMGIDTAGGIIGLLFSVVILHAFSIFQRNKDGKMG